MNDFQQLSILMVCLAAVAGVAWLVRARQH